MLADVYRDLDRPRLLGDCPAHALVYPPHRVCGETVPHLRVEFIRRRDEPCVALLDQVLEGETETPELLCRPDHEPEVSFNELVAGSLAASAGSTGQTALGGGGEEGLLGGAVQIVS